MSWSSYHRERSCKIPALNQVVRGIGHLAKVKDRDGRWPDITQVYMTPVRESRAMGEAITNVGPIRDKLC